MKLAGLCVLVVVLAGDTVGELPPLQVSYNILMLLPRSCRSHCSLNSALAKALANRGHKIVMLTPFPELARHPNITTLNPDIGSLSEDQINWFDFRGNFSRCFSYFTELLPVVIRKLYKDPMIQDLYSRRKEFDLIVLDNLFNEMIYPFVHEMPFITVSTHGMDPCESAVLGNLLNPAYVPSLLYEDYPLPMTAWHRFLNTLSHIIVAVQWRIWTVVPLVQKEISAVFPDLPPLLDIGRNQSLMLINSHFSMATTVPLLPSQVEVGALHCRPPAPLPQDLESWISGAGPEGVIYFSLGSMIQGRDIPVKYRDILIRAFRRLPHRVIWKYEEDLEGVSENVLIRKWLPQQDVLGHDNVKVFISHAGLLSIQESIYHATPLLVSPVSCDQHKNAFFVQTSGIGDVLVWEDMTVETIVDAVSEITTNPKYKGNVLAMSRQLRDQPTTPQESAVFWTEYVIRHRGAPHLRSPAAQLSWVEFLMLDVLFFLTGTVFIFTYLFCRTVKSISAVIFGRSNLKLKTQ